MTDIKKRVEGINKASGEIAWWDDGPCPKYNASDDVKWLCDSLLTAVEALEKTLEYCEGGHKCTGDEQRPCRIHEHNLARKALANIRGEE